MSAGWLGCQPERVAISEAQATPGEAGPTHWTWVATCADVAMVCSGSGEARRPEADADEPVHVTRALPSTVAACIERPVVVEGLFDNVGRLVELRPWPGETPEMRTCVFRALEDIDVPEGHGALVRFGPRDPWEDED